MSCAGGCFLSVTTRNQPLAAPGTGLPPTRLSITSKSNQAPSCNSHLPRSVQNKQKVLLQKAMGVMKRSSACTLPASFPVSRTWMLTNRNKHHQRYSSWASEIPHPVHTGTYMCLDKPCMGTWLFMFMLAGSMEVPEEVHARPSVFLPTATICEDQWCLFCCLLGLLSAWCHCLKRGLTVCSQLVIWLQLFP